jgi:hypothetical protein
MFVLGSFLIIAKVPITNFLATFFHCTSFVLILTKHALGDILGDIKKDLIWSPCPSTAHTAASFKFMNAIFSLPFAFDKMMAPIKRIYRL